MKVIRICLLLLAAVAAAVSLSPVSPRTCHEDADDASGERARCRYKCLGRQARF
jgi:hypothetical protein